MSNLAWINTDDYFPGASHKGVIVVHGMMNLELKEPFRMRTFITLKKMKEKFEETKYIGMEYYLFTNKNPLSVRPISLEGCFIKYLSCLCGCKVSNGFDQYGHDHDILLGKLDLGNILTAGKSEMFTSPPMFCWEQVLYWQRLEDIRDELAEIK